MLAAPFIVFASLTSLAYSATIKREQSSDIVCGDALRTGPLFYQGVKDYSDSHQLGINRYKAEDYIAKYPGQYVEAFDVKSVPCNSTYLNAFPSSQYGSDTPVKLVLVEDSSKCLVVLDPTRANSEIDVVDCSNTDDASQNGQFWSQAYFKYNTIVPIIGNPSVRYTLEFDSNNAVVANPPTCPKGQKCNKGKQYEFIINISA